MNKFISYEKLSKKKQQELNARKRADSFGCKMVSKVIPDKTKYNRKKQKGESEWD